MLANPRASTRRHNLWLMTAAGLLLAACGGGGGGGGPAQPDDPGNPPPQPQPPTVTEAFPNFAVTFATTDYWEYLWDFEQTTSSPQGASTQRDAGRFRITLGNPVSFGGRQGLAIELTGTPLKDFPWQAVAFDGDGIYASSNGVTWETVFDKVDGFWPGGGLFADFNAQTLTVANDGQIANQFITQPAIVAARSILENQCESIGGQVICGDEGFSDSEREYYDATLGVIGYEATTNVIDEGGGFTTVFNRAEVLGLSSTSLRGDVVDYRLEVEPNNLATTEAMPLTSGETIIGSSAREDNFGGGTTVFAGDREAEPNDTPGFGQTISTLPAQLQGDLLSGDAFTEVVVAEPGDNQTFRRTIEDFYAIELTERCNDFFVSHTPSDSGRIDMVLFVQEGVGLRPIANDLVLTPLGLEPRLNLDRTPDLSPGQRYVLGIDAVDVFARTSYTLTFGCSGIFRNFEREVFDWYAIELPARQRLTVSVDDAEFVLTNADGTQVLENSADDSGAQAIDVELDAGSYRIGVFLADEYVLQADF